MSTESFVVTSPTGVDVELIIAGPGSRAYAFLIDWQIRLLLALTWLAAAVIATRWLHLLSGTSIFVATISFMPVALIYFLYHPVVELAMRGRTPGQRMAGVRLVNRQGGTPSSLALLIRNAFRLIDSLPLFYGLGLCTTIFSSQRLRFGDMAAGTILVQDGEPDSKALSQLGALTLNPALDAETLALGNDLLLRWKELAPTTRRKLAHEFLVRIGAAPIGSPADADLQRRMREALAGRAA
jgi:uncharacterized RDD family membrane protein YckC